MDWTTTTRPISELIIDKTFGRVSWNMVVHQFLGYPQAIRIMRKDDQIAICTGDDFSVVLGSNGKYYADVRTALVECGLNFPLPERITEFQEAIYRGTNLITINIQ